MRLFVFSIFMILALCPDSYAEKLPSYLDDNEFNHCISLSENWNPCAKDEKDRVARDVKAMYRTILADDRMIEWNGSYEKNKQALHEMYTAWYAFKLRVCSLSVVAATYMPQLVDERLSCDLFFNLHHKNQLNTVLYLLNSTMPDNPYPRFIPNMNGEFDFLEIYPSQHDDAYKTCVRNKTNKNVCIDKELERNFTIVKNLIKTINSSDKFNKWNNAPDLSSGNLKDLFDSWIAYRNRLCSLASFVQKDVYGYTAPYKNICILGLTMEMREHLENLLQSSVSFLDEDYEPDTTIDAGLTEGKKIKPIKRKNKSNLAKNKSEKSAAENKKTSFKKKEIKGFNYKQNFKN